MIVPTKEPKLEDTAPELKEKDTPQPATYTVPTLASYTNLQKLKIERFLEQQSVIVLIDAGSTHNFVSSKVAARLMLEKEDYNGFKVKVANGQILKCNHKCQRVVLRGSQATMNTTQHLERVPREESSGFLIRIHKFQEMKPK
ncbi:hypothetical protein GW17_00031002 [Ensete ventricosum]|nr:hypothetical protein GW17_00031002 [Ensete ventricosum]